MRWISEVTRPYHGTVILLIFLASVVSALNLLNAVLLKVLIDAAVDYDTLMLRRSIIMLALLVAVQIIAGLLSKYYKNRTTYRICQLLQQRLFNNLIGKDFTCVTEKHSEEWMNRIISDVDSIASAVAVMIPSLIGIAVQLAGACYLLFTTAPVFVALLFAGGVFIVILNYLLRKQLKQRQRELRQTIGVKNVYLSEHLSKLMIVKAFSREDVVRENAGREFDSMTESKMQKLRVLLMKDGIQDTGTKFAYLLVIIYCAIRIMQGRITYGSCVMIMRILSQIKAPLTEISTYITNVFDIVVSAERLREAEAYPDDPAGPVRSDEEIRAFYDNDFSSIEFSDAAFSYSGGDADHEGSAPTVFTDVNISIPRRSCAAFTGITGSGKSTFFKLLMSLYPLDEGGKYLKLNDGSTAELDASYRRMFAYVPQGNQLMAGSIRDMVTFGERSSDEKSRSPANEEDRKIWSALETACAREFIEELPNGLDTVIKEKGLGLSEGQLQRIAIARAIYTERPVLLLDEATSSLDEATERELLTHLREMTDRTILIVTHRPAALSICDREVHIDGVCVSMREL